MSHAASLVERWRGHSFCGIRSSLPLSETPETTGRRTEQTKQNLFKSPPCVDRGYSPFLSSLQKRSGARPYGLSLWLALENGSKLVYRPTFFPIQKLRKTRTVFPSKMCICQASCCCDRVHNKCNECRPIPEETDRRSHQKSTSKFVIR